MQAAQKEWNPQEEISIEFAAMQAAQKIACRA